MKDLSRLLLRREFLGWLFCGLLALALVLILARRLGGI